MKEIKVYSKIHELKEKGFRKDSVAKQLGINWRTVDRYWDMSPDDYNNNYDNIDRIHLLDKYRETIVLWLKDYPGISAAQINDWLKENYRESFSQRTVSRYVRSLRQSLNLPKKEHPREYEAVADPPMGKQVQVDFGEQYLKSTAGRNVKIYAAAFVLSNSRYKYSELQSRPFTSTDLVRCARNCFRYFGGVPQELVFDQDSIVCVSENAGDIVYTYEFEKFRQECGFNVYMCRGADPESKGKIENTVKYIKGNFLANRMYADDESLNTACLGWLKRTANAKVHGTTHKVPAVVFEEERRYLNPLPEFAPVSPECLRRTVRKDNTILYCSNRYSLPLGTYTKNPEVEIAVNDGLLTVYTVKGDKICDHRLCEGRGCLIQNHNHLRDRETPLNEMQSKMTELFGAKTELFFVTLKQEKHRYFRDQCSVIMSLTEKYETDDIVSAIVFCTANRLFSANMVKDYLEAGAKPSTAVYEPSNAIPLDDVRYHVSTQKRSIQEYVKAGETL